jgi:general secretion pathway protein A
MYLKHYGLHTKPFGLNPDPAFLYFSSQHSSAYSMLEYGLLAQSGITVISGEVGAGKTTLLRHLLKQHNEEALVVGFMADTEKGKSGKLISRILQSFDIEQAAGSGGRKKRLQNFLIENYAKGKTTVLIVDEAQNLGHKSLENLRLLNNINAGQDELLKIILVGQPELLEKLQSPELMQLAQRVTMEFHLEGLLAQDAARYIHHRLAVAGARQEIFDTSAVYGIYYLAGGVPRLINTLCDYALVYGFANSKKQVGIEAVIEVAKGRKIGGINRQKIETEDMAIARSYVQRATGWDIAQVQADNIAVKSQ